MPLQEGYHKLNEHKRITAKLVEYSAISFLWLGSNRFELSYFLLIKLEIK